MTRITDHLGAIRARIGRAAATSGRSARDVTLVAVSKGHPQGAIAEAIGAGIHDFGENYLQEALPKVAATGRDAVWHFIGRIQSNKTREIASQFTWVQTVTGVRIAERLSSQRPPSGESLQVCIQVIPASGDGQKHGLEARAGCPHAEVAALASAIESLPRLQLRGLMLLPHPGLGTESLRAEFRATRGLFDELCRRGHALDTLSMGMSDDFELAIEEGSTMVRLGTALFGPRTRNPGSG